MPWGGFLIGGTVGQGAPRPLYPRGTRGIAPGPNLRRRRLLLQSFFRMMLGETMGQGAPRPLYPLGRGIPPAPVLRPRRLNVQTSFRMVLEGNGKRAHGRYENEKKSG